MAEGMKLEDVRGTPGPCILVMAVVAFGAVSPNKQKVGLQFSKTLELGKNCQQDSRNI
jgi:hypothetical protein